MEKTVITTLEPKEGYILLTFMGDLTEERLEAFRADLKEASALITEYYRDHGKKARILLDMTGFTGNYSLNALSELTAFAKSNVPFVEKTASFGGSDKVRMAGEIVVTLAHRDNIQVFAAKEEAVSWLL